MKISVENLSCSRGEDLIFDDVSFALKSGEALVISGPNGAGKSTLLRVLAGLLPHKDGAIEFTLDTSLTDDELPKFSELCHYIGHRNGMKSEFTVFENLKFWRDFMKGSDLGPGLDALDIEAAVDRVDLNHTLDLPFGYLSQGQQRRIALARLLIAPRPVWLLDEPTAALDKASDQLFSDIVQDYLTFGGIVIAATHLPLGFDRGKRLDMVPPSRTSDLVEDVFL